MDAAVEMLSLHTKSMSNHADGDVLSQLLVAAIACVDKHLLQLLLQFRLLISGKVTVFFSK